MPFFFLFGFPNKPINFGYIIDEPKLIRFARGTNAKQRLLKNSVFRQKPTSKRRERKIPNRRKK